jgi:UDP-N-acetylglucosamine acyltransferase
MIGGGSLVGQDIPPFTILTGEGREQKLRGLNLIGLKRRGFPEEEVSALKKAYRILAFSGLKLSESLEKMKSEVPQTAAVQQFISFIENAKRGICKAER